MQIYFHKNPEYESSLPDSEAHHCIHVMRHKVGDKIYVCDGNGGLYDAVIETISKKQVTIKVLAQVKQEQRDSNIHIVVSPTKNLDRMEFMVEKLTELGVAEISFVQTQRCERDKINIEKLESRAVAALKQSRNLFLPKLNPLRSLKQFLFKENNSAKWVAAISDQPYRSLNSLKWTSFSHTIIIGPEGDFTQEEINEIVQAGYVPVSLGKHILRTETAAIYAAVWANLNNSDSDTFQ